jgi:hypothetical protein
MHAGVPDLGNVAWKDLEDHGQLRSRFTFSLSQQPA